MALIDHKIPILTGVNDVPSIEGDPNHPNDSLLCDKYNSLIDDLVTAIKTDSQIRSLFSVTGSGSYNTSTGVITINTQAGADGANGADGRGITNTSYNASTGVVTFTFSDSTTFSTGDLRGTNGTNGTSVTTSVLTQSAYDAIGTKDPNTLYLITA